MTVMCRVLSIGVISDMYIMPSDFRGTMGDQRQVDELVPELVALDSAQADFQGPVASGVLGRSPWTPQAQARAVRTRVSPLARHRGAGAPRAC